MDSGVAEKSQTYCSQAVLKTTETMILSKRYQQTWIYNGLEWRLHLTTTNDPTKRLLSHCATHLA